MSELVGEIAALGTAVAFAVASTASTVAGRQTSAAVVNRTRLLLALTSLVCLHWLLLGSPLPLSAEPRAWGWLVLSGLMGLALGDQALFQAYVMIGPRLAMLVMALAPAIAAILAWTILNETLSARELIGIAVTLAGIASVVSEPKRSVLEVPSPSYGAGLLLALLGALGQAAGLVTAKLGLGYEVAALSGNVMRMVGGTTALWIAALPRGRAGANFRILRDRPGALRLVALAALAGPVAGVWLSLVALRLAPVGIASTLMSLTPIFLIPVARLVFQHPITFRAIAGTVVTCFGVALLFT